MCIKKIVLAARSHLPSFPSKATHRAEMSMRLSPIEGRRGRNSLRILLVTTLIGMNLLQYSLYPSQRQHAFCVCVCDGFILGGTLLSSPQNTKKSFLTSSSPSSRWSKKTHPHHLHLSLDDGDNNEDTIIPRGYVES